MPQTEALKKAVEEIEKAHSDKMREAETAAVAAEGEMAG